MARIPRLGLLDFNDERDHVIAETFEEAQKMKKRVVDAINSTGKVAVEDVGESFEGYDKMVWRPHVAKAQVKALLDSDVDGVIFHYSVWASPRLARIAAQLLQAENERKGKSTPIAVLTNLSPAQPGMVGGMAGSGGLDQLGIPNYRIWSIDLKRDREKLAQVVSFGELALARQMAASAAAQVVKKLRGQVYGEFGGRSIQIVTAEADPLQWAEVFGVDTQTVDQLEIVRRAHQMLDWTNGERFRVAAILDPRVRKAFDFLSKNAGKICFEGKFTPDKLKLQIACYYATQDIVKENEVDFFGVKCQPELSEYHVTQCLTQAFSNDRFGPAGEKKPIVVCSCEDDKDAAMTQQIMYLLTGNPTMFADFRHIDPERGVLYLVNCGAHTPWFATRSDNVKANLKKLRLDPQAFFYSACGATVNFDAAPGPVTGARLGRKKGKYWMNIVPGEFQTRPKDSVATTPGWPHAFMKFNVHMEQLFQEHPCNHIQVVGGDCTAGLVEVCDKLGIGYKIQDNRRPYQRVP